MKRNLSGFFVDVSLPVHVKQHFFKLKLAFADDVNKLMQSQIFGLRRCPIK